MIPLLDVAAAHNELRDAIEAAATRVLREGKYIGGQEVRDFESEFARFVGASHCIGVGNGLDALTLALRALGVGPGDEVIVPAHTFIATWLAVSAVGAVPIPVDPLPGDFLIDADGVEQALSPRSRAVIPVHLYGDPVNIKPILSLARKHDLYVVEDAAQAHGAEFLGARIGATGDAVAWSFYPGKNLGAAGDAGAVTTNSRETAQKIRELANYGSEVKYVHRLVGVNSRLDPIQAAVLRVKLPKLNEWNARRRRLASFYRSSLPESLLLKHPIESSTSAHHLMVITVPQRQAIREALREESVETGVHYPNPPYRQGAYREIATRKQWRLPVTDRLAEHVLSLPLGPQVSDSDVEHVIAALRNALGRRYG